MFLNRDCAAQKSEAAKLYVAFSFPQRIQVCVGEDLAFLIVDLTFQGQCDLFQVQCQLRSRGGFANCAGASIEGVMVARCTGCSSKLCLLFDPFQPRSLQQRRLHKNYNFGTATNYSGLEWS